MTGRSFEERLRVFHPQELLLKESARLGSTFFQVTYVCARTKMRKMSRGVSFHPSFDPHPGIVSDEGQKTLGMAFWSLNSG
jgi:hypothetical protein